MFFVGIDWSEQQHDVCVLDELGAQRATLRVPEGIVGVARFQELAAQLGCPPAELVIGLETDHGLLVHNLVATGYTVFAINPLAVSRYRDRHTVSGAKSDPGLAPSPIRGTPRSWLTWFGPIGRTTERSLATATASRPSRSWHGPTNSWSGIVSGW